jgi:23S rRNA pseudoU1915 N3-methylase RlmH
MRRYGGVEERVVKAQRFAGDVDAVRAAEGARLRAAARGPLVCLDERGDRLTTEGFAALVDRGILRRGSAGGRSTYYELPP